MAIDFYEHRVIDVHAKRAIDSLRNSVCSTGVAGAVDGDAYGAVQTRARVGDCDDEVVRLTREGGDRKARWAWGFYTVRRRWRRGCARC